uniref:AlNc14C205G8790 protein n=1 Tax=Albugo laibachii Nc14 TaxID=890382 RepID=F0WQY2_9STRA|nr:AlNc14C205G8790 [Albugo laibachii Nc14]|eukprot:CCA23742.1 AlNc14C205G8790 [Albugo laibachii Nc14]
MLTHCASIHTISLCFAPFRFSKTHSSILDQVVGKKLLTIDKSQTGALRMTAFAHFQREPKSTAGVSKWRTGDKTLVELR